MIYRTNLKPSSTLIDLTPLVDVVFLLLVFFIISSDILPLKSLNIENPSINRNSAPLTSQLLVIVDVHNLIYLGPKKEIVELGSLKKHIREQIEVMSESHSGQEPSIVLSVDRRVEYGTFLRVFSIAQECGTKVRLVYRAADEQERRR